MPRNPQPTHMVPKSRFTALVTKSERVQDHHHIQSAWPATESAFLRSDHLRLSRKVFGPPKHKVSLAPATKKGTFMSENAHGATTRAQSRQAHAPTTQTLRACAVEVRFEDFERHECPVNSSELAGHAHATPLIRHRCLTLTVRTPSVSTLLGENTY